MSRTFVVANSTYGAITLPASYTYPLTMACRWTCAAIGFNGVIIQLNTGTSVAEVYQHTDNKLHIDTSSTSAAAASPTLVAGTSYNIVAVFVSTTSRFLYVNGVLQCTDTQNGAATGQTFMVGKQNTGTPYYGSGAIQDAAFWSRALTANEALAFHRGMSPALMPYLLRAYAPMYGNGSSEPNLCGSAMTLGGSPAKAIHKPSIQHS